MRLSEMLTARRAASFGGGMSDLDEIKSAVAELPADKLAESRAWFAKCGADNWNAQIEADATAGRFDKLAQDALAEHRSGHTRPL